MVLANTSDNTLARFDSNGIELLIGTETGEVFASQGAIAKICNCESTQIRRFRGDSELIKTLPVKDVRGVIQETKLYPEILIKECIAKFNPELLLKCVDAGLRVFLHKMAGFEVKSEAIAPKTTGDMLVEMAIAFREQEKRIALLEQQFQLESQRIDEHEKLIHQHDGEIDRIFNPDGNYYTIRGYASIKNKKVSISMAKELGKIATRLSKEKGYRIDQVNDPRYGKVNCYSEYILQKLDI